MSTPITRRTALKAVAAGCVAALPAAPVEARVPPGWVAGTMTGARALVEALIAEGTDCVFGIPGAQENELWDEMKSRCLPYLLVTHEFSAACMADGAARATGKPGVLCVVPGPGVTNALSGLGEALLDSVPLVAIVGDVARGEKYHAFQVHELPQVDLLRAVTKCVYPVAHACDIPAAVRTAFRTACCDEPGPVAVVVPYNLLIETCKFHSGPLAPCGLPFDEGAFACALRLLANRRLRVGIYAGWGCVSCPDLLAQAAELLQAPVATSVSGKGVMSDCHPLAVGYGYGKQGTHTAEKAFKEVDLVLAVGVRYSEVSTAFYAIPKHRHLIQVDICAGNLGRVVKPDVCVQADAGLFFTQLLAHGDAVRRCPNPGLVERIHKWRCADAAEHAKPYAHCAVDPMTFLLALRRALCRDALVFTDVAQAEHWAAEVFAVFGPRTYFNPVDNQAMGWSIPAALGGQRVCPGRQTVAVTGDGCFLMSAMELSTAAREGLPVKFFVLDNQAYHYMQTLQKSAYRRTTATVLAHLDYPSLAHGFGLGYHEIACDAELETGLRCVLDQPGPVLARVIVDYGKRPVRWIDAARGRYTEELSTEQKIRFLARIGGRSLAVHPRND